MKKLICLTIVSFIALSILKSVDSLTVDQLIAKYDEIFPRTGNRNAASHLWSSYVLNRASNMKESEIYQLFEGFCPVSGSPIYPSPENLWQGVKVKKADTQEEVSVSVHFCCWPCVCDLQAKVKTDPLTINTADGTKVFNSFVIGNPCIDPDRIPKEASELSCKDGELVGATKSDNNYIVIGIAQPQTSKGGNQASKLYKDNWCDNRASDKYKGGMGRIFIDLASINPI